MIKENKFELGTAKYAARKLQSCFKRRDLTNPRLSDFLSTIHGFAEENELTKIKKGAMNVAMFLLKGHGEYKEVLEIVKEIKQQLYAMNEKRNVMLVRQISAGVRHKKKLSADAPVSHSAILPFDVVKVPTQGGMHLSIVWEVNDQYVVCFPMTTATRKDLSLFGVKSVSLSGCGDEKYEGVRLTESATQIAADIAARSYVESIADNPFICEKLAKVASLAQLDLAS